MTKLQNGWGKAKLRDVALVGAGDPAPQGNTFFENGTFPFVRTQDVGRLHTHPALSKSNDYVNDLAVETKRLKVWPEKSLLIPKSGASTFLNHRVLTAVPTYVASHLAVVVAGNQVLPEFLYFWSLTLDSRRIAADNNYPSLRLSDLEEVELPLPPLPVQERIVQILQRADEIRRKRQDALQIADAVLPAMFRDVFGDPLANPRGWKVDLLGNYLVDTRYGTSAKTSEYEHGQAVLRIPNVIRRTIDTTILKYMRASEAEKKALRLETGDILVVRTNGNKDYVGRCAVFDLKEEYLFASYLIRLRVDQTVLNPHYVVAYLATSMGRREIDTNSRTSAGQYNISVEGLRAIRILVPPIDFQKKFVDQYEQWKVSKVRFEDSLCEADGIFSCLLSRAFTGALTVDWEAANAEEIAARISFHEHLPRLLLLAFLAEKAKRAGKKTTAEAVLVTALMKYVFLFQMEGNGRRRLYQFVPYHYGPFAKELYMDLHELQEAGLVRVDNESEENKTKITLTDAAKTEHVLADLPDDLKEDTAAIIDTYGDLDRNSLLKRVYERYPAYAIKSRLRSRARRRE